jgi:serine/threonine-protein kinase
MMKSDEILKEVLKKLGKDYTFSKNLRRERLADVYVVENKSKDREELLKVIDANYILKVIEKNETDENKIKDKEEERKQRNEQRKNSYQKIQKRFVNEAKYFETGHPNIPTLYKTGSLKDKESDIEIPYLLVEHIKGKSLKKVIKEKSPLDLEDAVKFSLDILEMLSFLHKKNAVHRDLASENIIISNQERKAVFTYFGLAKDIISGTNITNKQAFMGTPEYMAPEQYEDIGKVDYRTDIYAFGVILFEMLTGELPFTGSLVNVMKGHMKETVPDISKKNPHVPPKIKEIIEKSMTKKMADRYQEVNEIMEALNIL